MKLGLHIKRHKHKCESQHQLGVRAVHWCHTDSRVVSAFLSALAGMAFWLSAQAAEPPDWNTIFENAPIYEIGQIPMQTAWEGSEIKFRVRATQLGSGTPVYAGFIQPPSETIFYEAGNFYYRPSRQDKMEFTVKFSASSGENRLEQIVPIQPIPHLPPERDLLGVERAGIPDATSRDYLVINDVKDLEKTHFNHLADRSLREVTISGAHVVLAKGHANRLHDIYGDNQDIRQFTINADTLTVRDRFWLPSTKVIIKARKVEFQDQGDNPAAVDTSPPDFPHDEATVGKDGSNGLPGGDIEVYAQEIAFGANANKRFVLTGGKGQKAGPGVPGDDGDKLKIVPAIRASELWFLSNNDAKTRTTAFIAESTINSQQYYEVYYGEWLRKRNYTTWSTAVEFVKADNGWKPDDGGNAVPGGRPGDGGKAGKLITSLPSNKWPRPPFPIVSLWWTSTISASGGAPGTNTPSYSGGAPGTPNPAVARGMRFYLPVIIATHTTTRGNDAPGKEGVRGALTVPAVVDGSWRWFTSSSLRQVVNHAKDAYLNNELEFAHQVIKECLGRLEEYQVSPAWPNVPLDELRDLRLLEEEMRLLGHRLASGMDYFGNPPGWVPLLSFESSMAAFAGEIEPAIRTLYLEYWLTGISHELSAKITALEFGRVQLAQESERMRAQYEVARQLIPQLDIRISRLDVETTFVQNQLQALESALLKKAEANTKGPMWKRVAKGLATIAKMIPIPVAQGIGAGLDIVSNFDPDDPWESLDDIQDVISQYQSGAFDEKANALNDSYKTITVQPLPTEVDDIKGYIDDLQAKAKPMIDSLTEVQKAFHGTGVPQNQIEAELARLKAESPEFRELVDRVSALLAEKQVFVEQLGQTIQLLGRLSANITGNLIMMDALNSNYAIAAGALNDRAVMYLKEMGRHARERLLFYHYVLKKAYEYRFLRPYLNDLNLEAMFNNFKDIAQLGQDHRLDPEQFGALRGLYDDILRGVVHEELRVFVDNARPKRGKRLVHLTANELTQLNLGKALILDLAELAARGLFRSAEEDLRIVDVKALSMTAQAAPGLPTPGVADSIDLKIIHSGQASVRTTSGGYSREYKFNHYTFGTEVPVSWESRYRPVSGVIEHVKDSPGAISLVSGLLSNSGDFQANEIEYFTHLGALTKLHLYASTSSTSPTTKLVLTEVLLEIEYDFIERQDKWRRMDLSFSDGLAPYVEVSRADASGRQDGLGAFARVYSNGTEVTVSVPERIGNMRFTGFVNLTGAQAPVLAGEERNQWFQRSGQISLMDVPSIFDGARHVLALSMNSDWRIQALYELMPPLELDIVLNRDDGSLALQLDGQRLTTYQLEEASAVTGPWSLREQGVVSGPRSLNFPVLDAGNRFYRVKSLITDEIEP